MVVERDPPEDLAACLGDVGEPSGLQVVQGFELEAAEQALGGRVIPRCRLRRLAMVEVGRFG